jgi:hypothetical protein
VCSKSAVLSKKSLDKQLIILYHWPFYGIENSSFSGRAAI